VHLLLLNGMRTATRPLLLHAAAWTLCFIETAMLGAR
jgi:hypothetical protein